MIIAPSGTGHDGPDFARITAPITSDRRKKYTTSKNSDRDEMIRRSHAEGYDVHALCIEYGLQKTTIRQILNEGKA